MTYLKKNLPIGLKKSSLSSKVEFEVGLKEFINAGLGGDIILNSDSPVKIQI